MKTRTLARMMTSWELQTMDTIVNIAAQKADKKVKITGVRGTPKWEKECAAWNECYHAHADAMAVKEGLRCRITVTRVTKADVADKVKPMPETGSIAEMYDEARSQALCELERIARECLRENPELNEFVMAMGNWIFTTKPDGYVYAEAPGGEFVDLEEHIDEWDDVLKLTSEPMRFTANGEVVREW